MQRFRLLPTRLFALLAALCLLSAQVGALTHGWGHALTPHAAQMGTGHADHADHDAHHDESAALCDLCAHYTGVLHVPAPARGARFAATAAALVLSLAHVPPKAAPGAIHYAARAPPLSLI